MKKPSLVLGFILFCSAKFTGQRLGLAKVAALRMGDANLSQYLQDLLGFFELCDGFKPHGSSNKLNGFIDHPGGFILCYQPDNGSLRIPAQDLPLKDYLSISSTV
jgi:hypothetical protein